MAGDKEYGKSGNYSGKRQLFFNFRPSPELSEKLSKFIVADSALRNRPPTLVSTQMPKVDLVGDNHRVAIAKEATVRALKVMAMENWTTRIPTDTSAPEFVANNNFFRINMGILPGYELERRMGIGNLFTIRTGPSPPFEVHLTLPRTDLVVPPQQKLAAKSLVEFFVDERASIETGHYVHNIHLSHRDL